MRINARPVGGRAAASIEFELTALAERDVPVRLVPRVVPGGLGEHKWIDRRLLSAIASEGDGEPLLCDLDGFVLEAARASVFCVESGRRVVTPPLDGRILPGVTRSLVLELAPRIGLIVSVEPLSLGRLSEADELFVTGALGGVEPAQLGGRRPAHDAGEVAARLARALAGAGMVAA
jgi:para-aminobenzoate synthetase/4-amino-4-deoxychorismate lyase